MGAPWWAWFLPLVFAAPWIAGIVWLYLRSAPDGDEVPPSVAEMARRRLWTR